MLIYKASMFWHSGSYKLFRSLISKKWSGRNCKDQFMRN